MKLLLLGLLVGCHPPPKAPAKPEVPPLVRVLIERDKRAIDCTIPIAGAAPDDPPYPPADEDFDARMWVHRRDYAKHVEHEKLLSMEVEALRKCLSSIANVEEE